MNSFMYGKSSIQYELIIEQRRTFQVAVYPDSSVVVKAPLKANAAEIEEKLRKKAHWILKQQTYFRQFAPLTPPRSFINGETHLYLGRQYRLAVFKGDEDMIKLSEGKLHVSCNKDFSPARVSLMMEKWYKERAKIIYAERFEICWEGFDRSDLPKPQIMIRKLKSRWGSLSQKGRLTLNANLIKAPKACIDYVITHELCHLIYPNHDAKFYRLLEKIMPDWAKLKNRLEQILS